MLVAFVALVGFALCLAATPTIPRRPDNGRDRRFVALVLASLLIIASVAYTPWPLHVAFAHTRSDFEAIARRLESGEHVAGPIRVGVYTVERAELDEGRACLWTDTNPSGRTGFVRNPRPGVATGEGSAAHQQYIQPVVLRGPGPGLGLHLGRLTEKVY